MSVPLVLPVLLLVLWSLIVWLWMYATRLPAMRKQGVRPQEGAFARELNTKMPAHARQVADNYNHLMEQPTVFYATCLALQVAHLADSTAVALAWAYVALRVVHSLVQATFNKVVVRFAVFTVSTLCLAALVLRGVGQLLAG